MMTVRDALAAKHFPQEWAKVAEKEGASKRRQKLRQRAEQAEIVADLRARGACCKTCSGLSAAVGALRFSHCCDADSDFYGTVEAKPDGLCHRWTKELGIGSMNLKRLDWVLCKAQEAHSLTPWEEIFVADLVRRRERHGDAITISDRQEDVLERIAEKD